MKIIEPRVEILRPKPNDGVYCLQIIEAAARISHRSEDKQTPDSWKRFIQAVVLEHGDWSVAEHVSASVLFRLDRGITHELVRHRLFSFTQESTRFVNYDKLGSFEYIYPEGGRNDFAPNSVWYDAIDHSEKAYLKLIEQGWKPQDARSVLPNALASTIQVTANLRAWRWLLLARTTKEAHPDFKRVSIPLLEQFKIRIPLIFDDIELNARQIDNAKKAH